MRTPGDVKAKTIEEGRMENVSAALCNETWLISK
jgi:hypothetical protein